MLMLRRFFRDTEATTAVEYSVMLAMILLAVITAVGAVGGQSGGLWGSIRSNLTAMGFGS
jgi:pilus assembly protein Flp/PilA